MKSGFSASPKKLIHDNLCSPRRIQDLRLGGRLFELRAQPIFFPGIDDSHCDRIHSSLTAVHCFDYSVGKVVSDLVSTCKKESMYMCTGSCEIIEITLKTVLNPHTINDANSPRRLSKHFAVGRYSVSSKDPSATGSNPFFVLHNFFYPSQNKF